MQAAIPFLAVLMFFVVAPGPAHAIVPCIKEQILTNEFVDQDTGNKGRMRFKLSVTEVVAPAPQFAAEGVLTLLDVVSGKLLGLKWDAMGDTEELAHASYLAAAESAFFKTGGSATGITLGRVDLQGTAAFTEEELLQIMSLVAGSYALSGGPDHVGVILDVAAELRLTLPDLLARPR